MEKSIAAIETKTLNLQYGIINIDDVILTLTTTPNLHTLNLSYCRLKNCDVVKIIDKIIKNTSIKLLNLCGNNIDGTGNIPLMLLTNKSLLKLNLSCNMLSYIHVTTIMHSLQSNSCLQKLNLSCNMITNDCAQNIATMLSINSTLRVLNISDNYLDDVGIDKIILSLHTNCTLQSLKLCRNYFGASSILSIATMLSINNSLKKISLRDILAYNDNLNAIIHSLQNNFTLTEMYVGFDYSDNDIETGLTLKPLLQRNKDLYDKKRFFKTKSARITSI